MTHRFVCDQCGTVEDASTLTGGKPVGWDVDFDVVRTITPPKTRRGREKVEHVRESRHYCQDCAQSKGKK